MASLQKRGQAWSCIFYWRDKRRWLTIGEVSDKEAEAKAAQVDYILMRLKQKLIALPEGADIVEFVRHDGKLPEPFADKDQQPPRPKVVLSGLKDRYLAAHAGALEENTLGTARTHFGHFVATLGEGFDLATLASAHLQSHIDRRTKAGVSADTAKKEVQGLRAAWGWARRTGLLDKEWPGRGLIYPKTAEKPPFQTIAEIGRKLARGGLADDQVAELWDSLYLTGDELPEFLEHVRLFARHSWIYPMAVMAAHAGARRSELARAQVGDVDFEAGTVTIREKKRVRGRQTTRRVPLSPLLCEVLKGWIAAHPGGNNLFCRAKAVARSRTRKEAGAMLTRNEAHDHFQRTLSNSKWSVVKGWHVLRHSFISACASNGVDQRLVQEWAGHMTPEMNARYTHIFPNVQRDVMNSVFGGTGPRRAGGEAGAGG